MPGFSTGGVCFLGRTRSRPERRRSSCTARGTAVCADPGRIAIYGGSYGGSTLAGITKEPELFACAVAYCGVSNIFTWLEAFQPYWEALRAMVHEMVGDPDRDAERLKATSPAFHVDRIRCPLLVAQGANDPRVRKGESDQIVAALRERGVAVEYLVKDGEGHGFVNEENQFEFYRAMEVFLAKHLGLLSSPSTAAAEAPTMISFADSA